MGTSMKPHDRNDDDVDDGGSHMLHKVAAVANMNEKEKTAYLITETNSKKHCAEPRARSSKRV